jgi:hypothetical protein
MLGLSLWEYLTIQNIVTLVVTSHISDDRYAYSKMAECTTILFEMKCNIFYTKNNIENL